MQSQIPQQLAQRIAKRLPVHLPLLLIATLLRHLAGHTSPAQPERRLIGRLRIEADMTAQVVAGDVRLALFVVVAVLPVAADEVRAWGDHEVLDAVAVRALLEVCGDVAATAPAFPAEYEVLAF